MTTKKMKSFFEQEDDITFTTITERFNLDFIQKEIIADYIHIKLQPNDSNDFYFSVQYQFKICQYNIRDQFLISQQKCADHVTSLISHMNLRPCIHHFLVDSISTSAIYWKNQNHSPRARVNGGGYSLHFRLKESANCSLGIRNCYGGRKDSLDSGELSGTRGRMELECSPELFDAMSRMELECSRDLSGAMRRMELECSGELSGATSECSGELSAATSRTDLECSEILTKKEIKYAQDHVTTSTTSKDLINGCFLQKETTKETIQINSVSIKSDEVSLSLIYKQDRKIRHDRNLNGNKINVVLERRPNPIATVNHMIPYRFLESEETCYDQITIVISELRLSPTTQEYIVRYITKLILHSSSLPLQGSSLSFTVNVNTEFNVDISLDPRRCGGDSSRILATEMDCPICLNELLSSEVSRMELPCSHVFHRHCIMTWLDDKSTCPICRRKVLGEIASIF